MNDRVVHPTGNHPRLWLEGGGWNEDQERGAPVSVELKGGGDRQGAGGLTLGVSSHRSFSSQWGHQFSSKANS